MRNAIGACEGVVTDHDDVARTSEFDERRNRRAHGLGICYCDKGRPHAEIGEAVVEQFAPGAAGGPVADNMVALLEQAQERDRDRRHPRGRREAGSGPSTSAN